MCPFATVPDAEAIKTCKYNLQMMSKTKNQGWKKAESNHGPTALKDISIR